MSIWQYIALGVLAFVIWRLTLAKPTPNRLASKAESGMLCSVGDRLRISDVTLIVLETSDDQRVKLGIEADAPHRKQRRKK